MQGTELYNALVPALWGDVDEDKHFPVAQPLLAHYTSVANLVNIVKGAELWFSNPLNMNDYEEMRYGLSEGMRAAESHALLRATCEEHGYYAEFIESLSTCYRRFESEHAFDTYVVCFSKHDEAKDVDGRLSMWRGYGGNGSGAAIVIDTKKINANEQSPFIIAPVDYGTAEERRAWISERLDVLAAELKRQQVRKDGAPMAAAAFFERLKQFALFSKHRGFEEEKEWRVVHFRDRDSAGRLTAMFGYHIGADGVHPKLKLKLAPIDGVTGDDFGLDNIVHQIILGPTHTGVSRLAALRMLQLERPALASRLRASSTPFRPS